MGGIIILSMIVSIFAVYVDNASQDSLRYGSQDFKITDNGYLTKINGTAMAFYYYPAELERINISAATIQKMHDSTFYVFLFSPNASSDDLAFIDVMRYDLSTQLNKQIYFAKTTDSENYPGLPVLSCANASKEALFFVIDTNTSTADTRISDPSPTENPYCITMQARLKELLALKDRLVYTNYGIMK